MRRGSTTLLGPVALTAVLAGCTAPTGTEPAARGTTVTVPVVTATVTATVTVPPDPASAVPDPAAPDPAPPDPAHRDPAPAPLTVAAARTPGATALACRAVDEALADAVVRYEVQALAEDGFGGGDRAAAFADMGEAMDRAVRAADAVPGLPAAAAPVVAELAALRDGMAARTDLDEEDAEPWRDARDRLEDWCAAHG